MYGEATVEERKAFAMGVCKVGQKVCNKLGGEFYTCFQIAFLFGAINLAEKMALDAKECVYYHTKDCASIFTKISDEDDIIELVNMYDPLKPDADSNVRSCFETILTHYPDAVLMLIEGQKNIITLMNNDIRLLSHVSRDYRYRIPRAILDCPHISLAAVVRNTPPGRKKTFNFFAKLLLKYGTEDVVKTFNERIQEILPKFDYSKFYESHYDIDLDDDSGPRIPGIEIAVSKGNIFMIKELLRMFPPSTSSPFEHRQLAKIFLRPNLHNCLVETLKSWPRVIKPNSLQKRIACDTAGVIIKSVMGYREWNNLVAIFTYMQDRPEIYDMNNFSQEKLVTLINTMIDRDYAIIINVHDNLGIRDFRKFVGYVMYDLENYRSFHECSKSLLIGLKYYNRFTESSSEGIGVFKSFAQDLLEAAITSIFFRPQNRILEFAILAREKYLDCPEWYDEFYYYVGFLMGLCVLHSIRIPATLPKYVTKMMICRQVEFEDFDDLIDIGTILDIGPEIIEDCMIPGCIEIPTNDGKILTVDLVNTPFITKDNYIDFVSSYFDFKIRGGCKTIFAKKLVEGFHYAIPESGFYYANGSNIFNLDEFESLVYKVNLIDVAEWKLNTRYAGGYTNKTKVVKHFWQYVRNSDNNKIKKIIRFVTSYSYPPTGGFAQLVSIGVPFCIRGRDSSLPFASTCTNTLYIRDYITYGETKKCLDIAIDYCDGFQIA